MPAILKVKTFEKNNLEDLELAINMWMQSSKVATELYLDSKISAVLVDAEKNKPPKMLYTAVVVYRQ